MDIVSQNEKASGRGEFESKRREGKKGRRRRE